MYIYIYIYTIISIIIFIIILYRTLSTSGGLSVHLWWTLRRQAARSCVPKSDAPNKQPHNSQETTPTVFETPPTSSPAASPTAPARGRETETDI